MQFRQRNIRFDCRTLRHQRIHAADGAPARGRRRLPPDRVLSVGYDGDADQRERVRRHPCMMACISPHQMAVVHMFVLLISPHKTHQPKFGAHILPRAR